MKRADHENQGITIRRKRSDSYVGYALRMNEIISPRAWEWVPIGEKKRDPEVNKNATKHAKWQHDWDQPERRSRR